MRTADEAWPDGYMAAKIQKLEMQFQADSKQFEQKSDIFKGKSRLSEGLEFRSSCL